MFVLGAQEPHDRLILLYTVMEFVNVNEEVTGCEGMSARA